MQFAICNFPLSHAARPSPWQWLFVTGLLFSQAGCHSLHLLDQPKAEKPTKTGREQVLQPPCKQSFRVSQFVFYADFGLKRDLPLFRELGNLQDQVYKELRLPSSDKLVNVYVFEDRDRYERFMKMKYPDLPKRRAFFVAQPHGVGNDEDRLVFTYWGDRVGEDLRHELTHALLHSVLKDVPLWLDEGLAEYFELSSDVPIERKGVNYQHLTQLLHGTEGPFKPDLSRLEQLSQVQQMSPAEYRESWAWVHFMLRSKPEAKEVLIGYLQQLRVTENPGPLSPRLVAAIPALDKTLERHLTQLETSPPPLPTAAVK